MTLSADKTPVFYDVLHCATPCATGEFSPQAALNHKGNIVTGNLPKIPGQFTDFGGRRVVYSTAEVNTLIFTHLMYIIMLKEIHLCMALTVIFLSTFSDFRIY